MYSFIMKSLKIKWAHKTMGSEYAISSSTSHPNLQERALASADQDFESGALRSQPLCDCDGSLLFQPAQSAVRWG